jgi:uncharacterized Ntn-hydrolase superfamily protein
MTFTVMGLCARSGEFGTCSATFSPATASRCPAARPHRGIANVQAYANPSLTLLAGRLLEQGWQADYILKALQNSDRYPAYRQIGIIDTFGNVAVSTGHSNMPWAGHFAGENYLAMGNVLANSGVVTAMSDAYSSLAGETLAQRLLCAIEAGRDAGGQVDGQRSAFLLVYSPDYEYPYIDLRVDVHEEPIGELRKLHDRLSRVFPYYAQRGLDPRMPRLKDWAAERGIPVGAPR